MSEQQQKRGPGRPRKKATRQHVDITLSLEALTYIDAESENRSAFIENCIWEHKRFWEALRHPQASPQ